MYDIETDEKWNKYWEDHKLYTFDRSDTKKPTYVIDTPPPFTSGTLHMGHVMSYTLSDFVARYKRMKGFNVLYPQGWDTQGFPTERAVEKQFGRNLPRDEFYAKCSEVAQHNIEKMRIQMRKLGYSFDNSLEYVTMSKEHRAKVQLSLILMHEKGFVYREKHPVEWCTSCNSAIAHAETEDKSEETFLNYVNFQISGAKTKHITIATTRPELMHACVAIAVNPDDDRFKELIGKKAVVPLSNQKVEIISDDKVDSGFGTGAEMICTFGDKDDRDMFFRHTLKAIESLDERGHLLNAGEFTGMKIREAREAVVGALDKAGALSKREKLTHTVKVHDRCNTEIEFIPSTQWFLRTKDHAEKIMELAAEMKWTPGFTKQYLDDWAKFIDWDWIFSRNRVFGTPIPFWYCEKCGEIVPPKKENLPVNPASDKAPMEKCPKCGGKLIGETSTCDVWIDSSITPLTIAGWPDNEEMTKTLVPSSMRLQGAEIIRTWAFYTIFRVWALTGKKAFENVLIHGMVLGLDGKRMHKSKGNGVSPDDVIGKYPIDAIRLWAALSGAIGKDKPFSYNDIEFAKGFITKLSNSATFVKLALAEVKTPEVEPKRDMNVFDIWITNRLNSVIKHVEESYEQFNFYEAANTLINFYWHEFCDFYIENVKHRIYSKEKKMTRSKHAAAFTLRNVLFATLRMLAPVIPHAAEEVNSLFTTKSITLEEFPTYAERPSPTSYVINGVVFQNDLLDVDCETAGAFLNNVIAEVRKSKAKARIALNKEVASININVPEEYYKAAQAAKDELASICKALSVQISKGDYSVRISA